MVFKAGKARKARKGGKVGNSWNVLASIIAGARGETRTPKGCPAGSTIQLHFFLQSLFMHIYKGPG